MTNRLVIFGTSAFAQIALEYYERDTDFQVTGFVVDDEFAVASEAFGRPVYPMSKVRKDPQAVADSFFVAATYTRLNRLRAAKYLELKSLGLKPASYVSPGAFIDPTVQMGEHCFIFEDNTLQPFVEIGDNVVLWSGNHIGHHSVIESNVFVSSHVVISGLCRVGDSSFLGVNSTVGNNVVIGRDNWIMPGTVILRDTADDEMWRPQTPVKSSATPSQKFL